MKDLLKEAVADANLLRETALENARAAILEAFNPRIQKLFSEKVKEEMEGNEDEEDDKQIDIDNEKVEKDEDQLDIDNDEETEDQDKEVKDNSLELQDDDELNLEDDLEEETMDTDDSDIDEDMDEDIDIHIDSDEDFTEDDVDISFEDDETEDEEEDKEDELDNDDELEENLDIDIEDENDDLEEDTYGTLRGEDKDLDIDIENDDEPELEEDFDLEDYDLDDEKDMNESDQFDVTEDTDECDTEEKLKESYKVIKKLQSRINESTLAYKKVNYINELLKKYNLSEQGKKNILKAFDKATTLTEAVNTFNTIDAKLAPTKITKNSSKRNLHESVKQTTKPIIKENTDLFPENISNRFKELARITKH